MKKLVCKECAEAVANTNNVLARHVRSIHGIEWEEYVVRHEHDGVWPVCGCGCGQKLPWKKGGFSKFVQGHDNKGDQNPMAQKKENRERLAQQLLQTSYDDYEGRWIPNPWTGQEEHIPSETEFRFFTHCVGTSDPVTRDHGFKVGWEDSSGRLLVYSPSFRHLKQKIIYDLDGFTGSEGAKRLGGIKDWCNQHGYLMLSLSPEGGAWNVTAWYAPKGWK